MSTDESSDRIATDVAVPPPNLSELDRQKAEIEAIQAQMTRLRARVDQRLDDQRPTIDLVPIRPTPPPPTVE
ncbi:hypothetical protein [Azospirillum brasilense]|uniref:Uncharacterized protein n=1 Tax=Azospirillum brasilense TaxID=192 RepID=A0A235HA35_AZOBR|nr:hypothetical protein [Azospirillum brasilense]OYD82679.1 hypothetical protein CHT98_19790 [Azospirillum brasilense]